MVGDAFESVPGHYLVNGIARVETNTGPVYCFAGAINASGAERSQGQTEDVPGALQGWYTPDPVQTAVNLSSNGFSTIAIFCEAPSGTLDVSNTTLDATLVQNVHNGPRQGTLGSNRPVNRFVVPGNANAPRPGNANGGGNG